MNEVDKQPEASDSEGIKSLDQFPELARRSNQHQFVAKHLKLIALVPLAIGFICLKLAGDPTNGIWRWVFNGTLIWALIVTGYGFYSRFRGVRCPACGGGFGVREECRSCGLPRHLTIGE